jgi:hypothetical protein
VGEDAIMKVAQFMIQHNIEDSRDIEAETGTTLQELMGEDYNPDCEHDPLIVNWLDYDLMRMMDGAMICGGGFNECLAEVRIMLEVLGVRYTLLQHFVYG